MEFNDIKTEFEAWRYHPDLHREIQLLARAEALDFLYFVTTLLPESYDPSEIDPGLVADAGQLAKELKLIDDHLFQRVRSAIADGRLRGRALYTYFDQFILTDRDGIHTNYGALDVLVDGIFGLSNAPAPTITPSAEMVRCEETPALAILDLVDQLDFGPTDRFYDLGCGLGQVVMLINLLCGVPSCGVEIEPAFVNFARQQAATLDLHNVCFLNGDAQIVEICDGTIFFLFTPFRGAMLRRIMARLQTIAQKHPIRVCTFGSCTRIVADEPWLQQRSNEIPHEYKLTIFDSHT